MTTAVSTQPTTTPSDDAYTSSPYSKPVMRQTQAMIGIVLLAATAAAFFVDPLWMILSGVVGVGLLFAGVSGVCPMASLIARMPWNKGRSGVDSDACCGR